MKNSSYVEKKKTDVAKLNLAEAARRAKVSSQRFRRALMFLQIPIERSGTIVLVDKDAIALVRRAFASGMIRPGRPTKKSGA